MLITLSTLVFIHLCALVTPGPDFFLVSQTAISRSRQQSMFVVAGITMGMMFWAMLAMLGLNIIFDKITWLRHVLLVLGGLYLCYLGIQMLRSAFAKKQNQEIHTFELPQSNLSFFLKGLLTNISNPKAVIYFGSVFSVFMANPVLDNVHFVMFILVSIVTFLWFSFVAFIFSLAKFKQAYKNATQWIDGISGGVFTAFGLFLIGSK